MLIDNMLSYICRENQFTNTHALFSLLYHMLCWTMSNPGPNSVIIDSSHCWWIA